MVMGPSVFVEFAVQPANDVACLGHFTNRRVGRVFE